MYIYTYILTCIYIYILTYSYFIGFINLPTSLGSTSETKAINHQPLRTSYGSRSTTHKFSWQINGLVFTGKSSPETMVFIKLIGVSCTFSHHPNWIHQLSGSNQDGQNKKQSSKLPCPRVQTWIELGLTIGNLVLRNLAKYSHDAPIHPFLFIKSLFSMMN